MIRAWGLLVTLSGLEDKDSKLKEYVQVVDIYRTLMVSFL